MGDDRRLLLQSAGRRPEVVEAERLAAVRRYDLLGTPPDGVFDRIVMMAARWLNMPIASVTIVDADRIWFKAVHGLRSVTQLGRGPGLCASAILQDEPLVIPDTLADEAACGNPLVRGETGVRFYAAAPILTADGHRLGTVNVQDTRPRQISQADVTTLVDLAAVVMDQLELRLSASQTVRAERELRCEAERDKAELEVFTTTLQRTLLPPALPRIPGLELACHYQTASTREVGGDFYDVFAIDERRWAFFLGDVCGKGASAAAVTSLVRYMLRAAALHHRDPIAVLRELNTALLMDTAHGGRFCTVVFGIIEPDPVGGFAVQLGTGGHPPPFVLHDSDAGRGTWADPVQCRGMLVGALPEATFGSTDLRLHPGEGLLLYTDGLIEGRPDGKELLGHEGLVAHLSTMACESGAGISAAQVVSGTVKLLDGFADGADDDVAILAVSALPASPAGDGDAISHSVGSTGPQSVVEEDLL